MWFHPDYWKYMRSEISFTIRHSRNYKRTGFVHPNSPIKQCSNECFRQSIINNLPFAQYLFFPSKPGDLVTSFWEGRENILIPHPMSHCGPTQLQPISIRLPRVVYIGAWISSNGAILKFRSFWFSFLACRGDKNRVEKDLTTKISTDFQQNNRRVCDCWSPESDSITGYLKAVKSW